MYLKNFILLVVANVLCIFILFLGRYGEVASSNYNSSSNSNMTVVETKTSYSAEVINSRKRVVSVGLLDPAYCIGVSQEDIDNLMRIVEAEAGCEDLNGKLLVAEVVINRVKSDLFPDNVTDVIYQRSNNTTQFSPVSNGRIYSVNISQDTKTAVYSALRGSDISKGALYFMARKYSEPQNVLWFENNLNFLFTYGNHDFYS